MSFGALVPKWRRSNKISPKSLLNYKTRKLGQNVAFHSKWQTSCLLMLHQCTTFHACRWNQIQRVLWEHRHVFGCGAIFAWNLYQKSIFSRLDMLSGMFRPPLNEPNQKSDEKTVSSGCSSSFPYSPWWCELLQAFFSPSLLSVSRRSNTGNDTKAAAAVVHVACSPWRATEEGNGNRFASGVFFFKVQWRVGARETDFMSCICLSL